VFINKIINKKYSKPELKEGFQEIHTIPFYYQINTTLT